MTTASTHRDPRSVVTPDAFEVSPELLGLRLAPPGKRLVAILVDLVVIGVITAVTESFALILGVVVAILFVRAGFKRTPVRSSAFDRAMRASVGCLGVFIAMVTAALWAVFGIAGRDVTIDLTPDLSGAASGVLQAIGGAAVTQAYTEARTLPEAERATRDFIEAGDELGMSPSALRALLVRSVPRDAPWAAEAPALFDRLLPTGPPPEAIEARDLAAVRDGVSLYSTEEVLEAYAEVLRAERQGEMDVVLRQVLEQRIVSELAADTLDALQERIEQLQDENDDQMRDLREARERLDDRSSGGVFGGLRSLVDELGFGFGWATLYMTVILSWWKGQTLGKRLLRIRVLRLDGGPITWWVAFERAGGYAAGFATGLLGFAQVFWDANRQAIHDRIVGTVVVLDGEPKVIDWESAL